MIRTSQRMYLLDESRWKKHGERYSTVITDDRGDVLRSSMRDREQCSSRCVWTSMSTMLRETLYTSRVNRNFRCFEQNDNINIGTAMIA
ncbi:hypothetical protein AVEN_4155-1 [Araneus ventricosus]|uniref:Uncharacterized protein n=1 Tax=Araneus ventricosus TaxID=182803 RepID=A0A4Y2M4E5_ARAVE|nr:hypothetical protein AVEN_4155-1 [Araneus ventricosus]